PTLVTDFDHDGKLDLVSFSFGSGNPVRVHFFRGNGDGTFAPKTTFDTDLPNAVTPSMRTINGGLEFLVSENFFSVAIIRYANGKLSVTRYPVASGHDLRSTFADVNNDGVADIVATTDDGTISLAIGSADGTFREAHALSGNVYLPATLRAADMNGDGNVDLVVSDFRASTLYVFYGDGTGNFAQPRTIDAGGAVNTFAIADVNGDGRNDVVTANNDHTISVLINRSACGGPPRRRASRH